MKCVRRSTNISPFYVMELLEKAQALEANGIDVVHMEIGEPDFATPKAVKEAAIEAIEQGHTFYAPSLGLTVLRERIAQYYWDTYGTRVSPDRVIITNGTSGAFFLLSAILLSKRRNFVISDPGYPCYRNFGALFDARLVTIPVTAESHFEITAHDIEKTGVIPHVVMLCTPSNPTGAIYRKESLAELHEIVCRKGGVLVVDEIYSGLVYDNEFSTALSVSDNLVVIDGFSKTYAMTGWRLGWMIVPEWLVRPAQKVSQNVFISAPTISQYAALKAFDATDELETMRNKYRERRDVLFPRLKRLGFELVVLPEGAFYIYAGIGKWGMDSMEFVDRALAEANVAITPGYDFGSYQADSHVRFSYASSADRLQLGCDRLESWLSGLPNKG